MRRLAPAVTALGLVLAIAACGSDQSVDEATGGDDGNDGGDTSGEVSIETDDGTVALDEPAVDVVALEWSLAEDLLALGIEPAGVADVDGYGLWVAEGPQLSDDVVDVGTRQEPSLEKIESLDPDLILTDDDRTGGNTGDLDAIAPTYSPDFYGSEGGQLQTMRDIFTDIATLTDTEDTADDVLADLDARAEEFETALQESDVPSTFLLTQGYTYEGAATVRVFGQPTMASELLEDAGMTNGWTGDSDDYGLTDTDVEGLTNADPQSSMIYVAQEDDNIFTGELADNPVYQGLDFVANDRVHPIDPGTWLWGGPITAVTIYDEVAAALGL